MDHMELPNLLLLHYVCIVSLYTCLPFYKGYNLNYISCNEVAFNFFLNNNNNSQVHTIYLYFGIFKHTPTYMKQTFWETYEGIKKKELSPGGCPPSNRGFPC